MADSVDRAGLGCREAHSEPAWLLGASRDGLGAALEPRRESDLGHGPGDVKT